MIDKADGQIRSWAVLIGINLYVNDRLLKGCVRDVEIVEQYLHISLNPSHLKIMKLTTTASSDKKTSQPQERPELLSIYQNVIESLQ